VGSRSESCVYRSNGVNIEVVSIGQRVNIEVVSIGQRVNIEVGSDRFVRVNIEVGSDRFVRVNIEVGSDRFVRVLERFEPGTIDNWCLKQSIFLDILCEKHVYT